MALTKVKGSVFTAEANKLFIHLADDGVSPSNPAATNAAYIQSRLDSETSIGATLVLPRDEIDFSSSLTLRPNVSLIGHGSFASSLVFTGVGLPGLYSPNTQTLNGVRLANFKLLGTAVTNASENGIHIEGSPAGAPKLLLHNLLVSSWGNKGIYLLDCWDGEIKDTNASGNKADGMHLVNCFAFAWHRNVCYRNLGTGLWLQSAAGGEYVGNVQENYKTGIKIESAKGCSVTLYAEQNGHAGATAAEMSQVHISQRAGGYKSSSGNTLTVYGLGGKGAVSGEESSYGVYVDYGYKNTIQGNLGGHLVSDLYFTSNSQRNIIGPVEHETGLTGGDSPSTLTDNGSHNFIISDGAVESNVPSSGVANSGSSETDLLSVTLPGGSLYKNGQSVEIVAYGQTAANTNNKTLKLYFGGSLLLNTGAVPVNNKEWTLRAVVTRRGSTIQYSICSGIYDSANVIGFTAPAETLASDVVIKCTGQGVASGDITHRGLLLK